MIRSQDKNCYICNAFREFAQESKFPFKYRLNNFNDFDNQNIDYFFIENTIKNKKLLTPLFLIKINNCDISNLIKNLNIEIKRANGNPYLKWEDQEMSEVKFININKNRGDYIDINGNPVDFLSSFALDAINIINSKINTEGAAWFNNLKIELDC